MASDDVTKAALIRLKNLSQKLHALHDKIQVMREKISSSPGNRRSRPDTLNYNLDQNVEEQWAVKAQQLFGTGKPAQLNPSKSAMFTEYNEQDTYTVECYDDISPDLAIKLVEFVRGKER